MPLPVIGAGLGAAIGGIGGGLLSAAGSIFSGQSAADFAERSYKHRYQWQVKDLQKAGLNPMLAIGNAAPNVPQPNFPNVGEALSAGVQRGVSSAVQARLAKAQVENVEADTQLKGTASAANIATARESSIRAGISEASLPWAPFSAQATALNLDKQGALMMTQIQNIAEDTRGKKLTNDQLERMQPLLLEAQRLVNSGMSADLVRKEVYGRLWSIVPEQDTVDSIMEFIRSPGDWPRKISEWGKKHGYSD